MNRTVRSAAITVALLLLIGAMWVALAAEPTGEGRACTS
jgi:hypothetical protein